MKVFDIVKPGSNIDLQGFTVSEQERIEGLVLAITSAFNAAAVALEMFKSASSESISDINSREDFLRRRARGAQLREEINAQFAGVRQDFYSLHRQDNEISRLLLIEEWREGKIPKPLLQYKIGITARAFIFALDEFEKCLKKLAKVELPQWPSLGCVHNEMLFEFAGVCSVRNTVHHIEDRVRGKKSHEADISIALEVETSMFKSDSGGIFLGNIDGCRYMTLLENGQQGHVDISEESMDKLAAILIKLYACFSWKGRETLLIY